MLTLYTWKTPNGRKPSILLEELEVPYFVKPIDISKDEQFTPEFLAISPNNKIPALVDDELKDGTLTIFESGAILTYLAEKYGRFLEPSGNARYKALEWLYWQVGGLGPMFGQLGFFAVRSKEKSDLAITRFTDEANRLLDVLETRLAAQPYLAGPNYSIADIAIYPWMISASETLKPVLGEKIAASSATQDWLARLGERPAVQRGMALAQLTNANVAA